MKNWSKDYQEAKKNFNQSLDLLNQSGLNIMHQELNINEKDPYGNDLYIDAVWIGNLDADKVFLGFALLFQYDVQNWDSNLWDVGHKNEVCLPQF